MKLLSEAECNEIIEDLDYATVKYMLNTVYGFMGRPTVFGYDIREGVGKRLWKKLSIKYYQTY